MEEAEEAARVQAEAALALGSALASAGGGHDVVCWRRPQPQARLSPSTVPAMKFGEDWVKGVHTM